MSNAPAAWVDVLPQVVGEAFPQSRDETRRALVTAATVRCFAAGHAILRQGDSSAFALVLDGHVAARRTTVDGRQLIVRIMTRGGLASLLPVAARPAVADAVAVTPTPAALWNGSAVRSLASNDPGLALDILEHALVAYEEAVGRIDTLLRQNALRRVARILDLHRDLFFPERPVLTRGHLPFMVGTSREMTGRVLRTLESRGIVARIGRNRLRLLDPAGLAAAAETVLDRPGTARGTSSSSAVGGR